MANALKSAAAHVLIAGAVSTANAQFTVNVNSAARYQGAPQQLGSQTVIDPPMVLGDVAAVSSLSDPAMDGFSFAEADSRFGYDTLGGYSRNFARASGWAPGHGSPSRVSAASTTNAAVAYRVTSPSTPAGTPIQVRTFLAYSGELGIANYFGVANPGTMIATFGSTFTIDGVPYFDATASLEARFPNGVSAPVFTSTGPWGSAWTSSTEQVNPMGDYTAYTLLYSDVVNFNSVMAADFDVVFRQTASADIPGPYEAFAQADFANTGRFSFLAFDPVTGAQITDAQFSIVPAPGSLAIALGMLAPAIRRRR